MNESPPCAGVKGAAQLSSADALWEYLLILLVILMLHEEAENLNIIHRQFTEKRY